MVGLIVSAQYHFFYVDLLKIAGHEDTSIKVSEPRESQPKTDLVTLIFYVLFLFSSFKK